MRDETEKALDSFLHMKCTTDNCKEFLSLSYHPLYYLASKAKDTYQLRAQSFARQKLNTKRFNLSIFLSTI